MPIKRKQPAKRTETKILIMLALFSISVGLWENFRQLWLQENGFTAQEIGNLSAIGTVLSAVAVLFIGKHLKFQHLKVFITLILALKVVNLFGLFGLGQNIATAEAHGAVFAPDRLPIDLIVIVDFVTTYLIVTSVYPLITTVIKSNKAYSRRKLVEYLFRDIGVLIGGILMGRYLFGLTVNYNGCLLVSIMFMVAAILMMFTFKTPKVVDRVRGRQPSITKYILASKIQTAYMIYAFLAAMSFATALGLKMLMLTDYLQFTPTVATNFLLITGIIADIIGVLALKYLTPKNDYLTMTLKFGVRLIAYIVAVLTDNNFIFLLAITWSLLISTAYEDITDGYYINRVENKHQFRYNTFKYVISFLGEAAGMLLCGIVYEYGIGAILGSAAVIMVFQIVIAYHLIYLRTQQERREYERQKRRHELATR